MDKDIDMNKIAGGLGCDIVTGTSEFTARRGRIYMIMPREDNSGITSIVEDQKGTEVTVATGRSYLGTNTLKATIDMITPDFPVKKLTPAAGSFIVYYSL